MAVVSQPMPSARARGRRLVLIGVLALIPAGIAAALIFAWPRTRTAQAHFELGSVDDFTVGSVTTVAKGKFHLVRLSDTQFVALSWREPSHGCMVPWRPTFVWPDAMNGGALTSGWFRDPCTGSTFSRDGTRVFGPSTRDMDQYPVSTVGGQVTVDTSRSVCGKSPPGVLCAGQLFPSQIAPPH